MAESKNSQGEELKTMIFRSQEDNKTILETEGYKSSLFLNQYVQALSLIQRMWKDGDDADGQYDSSNVIAFCGDRGEGKTSCLRSVRYMLSNKKSLEEIQSQVHDFQLKSESIFALELLDPSYFDDTHNVVELVMGQLFEIATDNADSKDFNINNRKELMKRFQRAKACMSALKMKREVRRYDEMEELSNFAASVQLKKAIKDLFSEFLRYYKKEKLLICVDDLDMNMEFGYQMVEDIRKYLCTTNCFIFVAVKIDQLLKLVQSSIVKSINTDKTDIVSVEQVEAMAQKYVAKFIPENHRIKMPLPHFIAEQKVALYLPNGTIFRKGDITIKETIVRLIFDKTRYLFYNGRTTSLIVPKNLRAIRQLLGMLSNMPDIPYGEANENKVKSDNKTLFRAYFYQSWIKNLSSEDQSFATRLSQYEDVISVNKYVTTYLGMRCANQQISPKDSLYKEIIASKNRSHNVSVGDVYYIIRQIETINTDEEIATLLFFICAFYSMGLYARYDELIDEVLTQQPQNHEETNNQDGTEQDEQDGNNKKKGTEVSNEKTEKDENVSIYKHDRLYEGTNTLQKVLNGAYFTYEPGTLIVKTMVKDPLLSCRDRRVVNGALIGNLITELNSEINKGAKIEEGSDLYNKMHRCEYFIMTTLYQVDSRNPSVKLDRTTIEAPFIGTYESIVRLYIAYDYLALFYNIVNIQYAFHKFGIEGKKLWNYVRKEPLSLYNKMIAAVCAYREIDVNTLSNNEKLHQLLSDAVIRVSEVQLAIVDALNSNRKMNKHRDNSDNTGKLYSAYDDITKLGISLYPNENGTKFALSFAFLQPIIQYLKDESEDEFNKIFNVKAQIETDMNNISPDEFRMRFPSIHASTNVNTRKKAITLLRNDAEGLPNENDSFWALFLIDKPRYKKAEILAYCLANYHLLKPYL